jgi:hypothetical protein
MEKRGIHRANSASRRAGRGRGDSLRRDGQTAPISSSTGDRGRHAKVSSGFIPGGGTLNDAGVQAEFLVGRELGLTSRVQYEHWNYPILAPQPLTNVAVSVRMTYWPHWHVK